MNIKIIPVPKRTKPKIEGRLCLPSWSYLDGNSPYKQTDLGKTFAEAKARMPLRTTIKVGAIDDNRKTEM